MQRRILRFLLLGLLLAVTACGYSAPNVADTTRPSYAADLAACQTAGDKEAQRLVMSKGGLFLTYPISLPIEQRLQIRKCMNGKGYAARG
jgi:hypothetical protein